MMATPLGDLVARLGGHCLAADGSLVDLTRTESLPGVASVHLDGRDCGPDSLYVALPGTRVDGSRFVPQAAERGARVVLAPERLDGGGSDASGLVTWVHPEARRIAGEAAAWIEGHPSQRMRCIGITGTNGKTTTAHLIAQLSNFCGQPTGLLGTAGHRLADGTEVEATHTTPDAPNLQRLLARQVDAGAVNTVLEVSSHALCQERHAGTRFQVAVFTNLSRDHLDFHGSFTEYADAKARLFEALGPHATAILNAGDPASERMAQAARSVGARVVTYGIGSRVDLSASRLEACPRATTFYISGMGIEDTQARLPLLGRFNVENALAAIAVVLLSGASPSRVLEGLASASSAPGRLEEVPAGDRGFRVLVDYAHTDDALRNVCASLRDVLREGGASGARLITVFGCGGDRDRGKRAPMGAAAAAHSDLVILTSDNPRSEDPMAIVADVLPGLLGSGVEHEVVVDRREALARAVEVARPGDLVLIAGKGHERVQIVGDREVPFDDREVLRGILA